MEFVTATMLAKNAKRQKTTLKKASTLTPTSDVWRAVAEEPLRAKLLDTKGEDAEEVSDDVVHRRARRSSSCPPPSPLPDCEAQSLQRPLEPLGGWHSNTFLGRLRLKVWLIMELPAETSCPSELAARIGHKYEVCSLSLVLATVLLDILLSVKALATKDSPLKVMGDYMMPFAGSVFTAEYALRLWSCVEAENNSGSCKKRLSWMKQGYHIIDLLVVSGFLLSTFVLTGSSCKGIVALRMVRLLRLSALFKADKMNSIQMVVSVFSKKKHELGASLFVAVLLMITSATLMYYIENETQPDVFSSIPASMWWASITLTTVGYGDVTPKTNFGQALGSLVAIFGIGIFALPAGILGSGFADMMQVEEEAEASKSSGVFEGLAVQPEGPEAAGALEDLRSEFAALRNAVLQMQQKQDAMRQNQDMILATLKQLVHSPQEAGGGPRTRVH